MWHVSYVTSYWNSGKKPWHDPHTDCDLRTSQERSKSLEPTVGPSHKVILKGIPLGRLNSNPICLFRTDTYWANLSSKLLNHWSELLRPFQKPQHHTTSTENSPQSLQQRNSVKTGCSKKNFRVHRFCTQPRGVMTYPTPLQRWHTCGFLPPCPWPGWSGGCCPGVMTFRVLRTGQEVQILFLS